MPTRSHLDSLELAWQLSGSAKAAPKGLFCLFVQSAAIILDHLLHGTDRSIVVGFGPNASIFVGTKLACRDRNVFVRNRKMTDVPLA